MHHDANCVTNSSYTAEIGVALKMLRHATITLQYCERAELVLTAGNEVPYSTNVQTLYNQSHEGSPFAC